MGDFDTLGRVGGKFEGMDRLSWLWFCMFFQRIVVFFGFANVIAVLEARFWEEVR